MGKLRVLLPWLALFHLLEAASASSMAKPGCVGTCGDVEVPYPFGLISPTCSLGEDFSLSCNESADPPKLMWGHLQVLNLNVERGELTLSLPISYGCYMGGQMTNQKAYYHTTLIENSPFTFSIKNKFTTIGCDALGLFSGSWGKRFTGGCATYCSDLSILEANSSSCDGVGCCQTAIPKGVRLADINITSFGNYSNFPPSANYSNCGYAFLVKADNFTFRPSLDLKANPLFLSTSSMPVLVDWAIGREKETCQTSTDQKGAGGSGCLAQNSTCIPSAAGYGYRCNCSQGFQGNPYLEHGCQDINECANSELNNCTSGDKCVNMDGGFRCKPRSVSAAYRAVAASVSSLFLLLGVGRLVFRYNLVPKWVSNAIKQGSNQKKSDASSSTGEDKRRNAKKKKRYPVVEGEYLQETKKYKKKLRALIYENSCAPIMLCLAWQDVNDKTGKPFGTITHQFTDGDINKAVNLLAKLKREHSFNKAVNLLAKLKEEHSFNKADNLLAKLKKEHSFNKLSDADIRSADEDINELLAKLKEEHSFNKLSDADIRSADEDINKADNLLTKLKEEHSFNKLSDADIRSADEDINKADNLLAKLHNLLAKLDNLLAKLNEEHSFNKLSDADIRSADEDIDKADNLLAKLNNLLAKLKEEHSFNKLSDIDIRSADEDINKADNLVAELDNLLAKLKEEHSFNKLSDADIRQLAGVVAVEVAGGPDVAFHPGREDKADKDINKEENVRRIVNLSLSVHDIVAISPWLRCNGDCSGFQFTWPPTFDNSYFKHLISGEEKGRRRGLPDHGRALLKDAEFLFFVKKYAADEASFFADYAKSHMKLSELGFADAD